MREVDVLVSEESESLLTLNKETIHSYVIQVLDSCDIHDYQINVVFVNDTEIAELNEKYRKKSGATDVLSFFLSDNSSETIEGEVYISLERAKLQSVEYSVTFEEEVIRLSTHGLLHLAGRVHDTEERLDLMNKDTEKYVRMYFNNGDES